VIVMAKLMKWGLLALVGYLAYRWYVTKAAATKPAASAGAPIAGAVTNATGITAVPANTKDTPAVTSIVFDDTEADTVWGGGPSAGAQ
jgi:uncharacterized membrane protein YebE (DUF533 family)